MHYSIYSNFNRIQERHDLVHTMVFSSQFVKFSVKKRMCHVIIDCIYIYKYIWAEQLNYYHLVINAIASYIINIEKYFIAH